MVYSRCVSPLTYFGDNMKWSVLDAYENYWNSTSHASILSEEGWIVGLLRN